MTSGKWTFRVIAHADENHYINLMKPLVVKEENVMKYVSNSHSRSSNYGLKIADMFSQSSVSDNIDMTKSTF